MGLWFSRFSRPVGSEPFYASLEKSLERLRVETNQMKVNTQYQTRIRARRLPLHPPSSRHHPFLIITS